MATKNECPRDYSKGKIYMIRPISGGEDGEIYIGSTTKQYLSQRMTIHRNSYNNWKKGRYHKFTVYDLFDKYGLKGCEIVLIENVNCNSIDELLQCEKYHIQNNNCVNKVIPLRKSKDYYIDNAEIIKEKNRQFRHKNLERVRATEKKYYDSHRESRNLKCKEYHKDNANKRKEKRTQPFNCVCGSIIQIGDKAKHFRTLKHLAYIEQQQNIEN